MTSNHLQNPSKVVCLSLAWPFFSPPLAQWDLILIGGIIPRSADHMTGSTVTRPGLSRSVKRANFRLSCCDLGARVSRHYQDTHARSLRAPRVGVNLSNSRLDGIHMQL